MSNGVPKWITSLMFFDPYVSVASAVVNSFHLLVICQKSMRTSSTNSIMIGIALTIICWMYKSISYLFRNAYIAGVCWIPSSYFSEFVSWIATSLQDHFKRCDALLGISLGLIRVIALKYPVGSVGGRFDKISNTSFGWKIFFIVYLINSLLTSCFIQRTYLKPEPWTPSGKACEGLFPENYTQPRYSTWSNDNGIYGGMFRLSVFLMIDTLLTKITPCIMYPIVTFMLINQLQKFGKTRDKLLSTRTQIQNNSTTRSILCITIAYIISQLPLGLLYLRESFCTTDYNCYIQINNLMLATVIPSILTTITHMPICFVLSSQYRQAFKSVFKFGRKNEVGPEETEGTVNSSLTINENPKDKENN